jgi:hypothetical protein
MVEKISVQIALEGTEEIKRQLAGVSAAGQKCFEDIAAAAAKAGGFDKLDPTLVARKFSQFGVTATGEINKITDALQTAGKTEALVSGVQKMEKGFQSASAQASSFGTVAVDAFGRLDAALIKLGSRLTRAFGPLAGTVRALGPVGLAAGTVAAGGVALVKFASAAEETHNALTQLQEVSGQSFKNLSTLSQVFEQGGTSAKQFATEFTNLQLKVTEAASTMSDDVEQSSLRIVQANQNEKQAITSLAAAQLNLQRARLALADTSSTAAQQQLTIQQASLNLAQAEVAARKQLTGKTDPAAEKRLADARAQLSVQQAQEALRKATADAQKKDEEDRLALIQKRLAVQQAEQQVAAARLAQQRAEHEARDAEANDLAKVIDLYRQMGEGAKVAFDPLTTEATKTKALFAALAKAGDDWKLALADILKNATGLERVQIGKALGLDPKTIDTLKQGSAALQQMTQKAQQLGLSLDDVDQKNLKGLIKSQDEAGGLFDALKDKMGALVAPAISSFWEGFTQRLQQLIPVFTQIATSVGQLDFSKVGAAAADFFAWLGKIAAGWANILSGNVSFSQVLSQAFQEAGKALVDLAWQIGIGMGRGIIGGIISAIQDGAGAIWDAIKSTLGIGGGGAPATDTGGGEGLASGGLIGGRGSGTSDSNLAWVSRGEHIMPARAVAQPGVLALLEALRRSGGNLSGVLDGLGRFSLGGMVPRPAMAFAGGGLVGGANLGTLTLALPGGGSVAVRASSGAVEEIRRAAALAQVRSGGRKPSRYS